MDILLFGDMVSRMGDTLENPFLGRLSEELSGIIDSALDGSMYRSGTGCSAVNWGENDLGTIWLNVTMTSRDLSEGDDMRFSLVVEDGTWYVSLTADNRDNGLVEGSGHLTASSEDFREKGKYCPYGGRPRLEDFVGDFLSIYCKIRGERILRENGQGQAGADLGGHLIGGQSLRRNLMECIHVKPTKVSILAEKVSGSLLTRSTDSEENSVTIPEMVETVTAFAKEVYGDGASVRFERSGSDSFVFKIGMGDEELSEMTLKGSWNGFIGKAVIYEIDTVDKNGG